MYCVNKNYQSPMEFLKILITKLALNTHSDYLLNFCTIWKYSAKNTQTKRTRMYSDFDLFIF